MGIFTRRSRKRAAGAGVAALTSALVLAGGLTANAADGVANDVSDLVVGDITVTETSKPGDGEWGVWEQLDIKATIDTQKQSVDAGDWFTIQFPIEFQVTAGTFTMSDTINGVNTTLANCDVTGSEFWNLKPGVVTCTFTDAAATRQYLNGAFTGTVTVNDTTAPTDTPGVEFRAGTTIKYLAVPGDAFPRPGRDDMVVEFRKGGWQDNPSNGDVKFGWVVTMPAELVKGVPTIHVEDTLQGDTLLIPQYFQIQSYADSAAWKQEVKTTVYIAEGTNTYELQPGVFGDVTLDISEDRKSFTMDFPNNDPGENGMYRIYYYSTLPEGVRDGAVVGNSVVVNGGFKATDNVTYSAIYDGELFGPGYGGFNLTKLATGPDAANIIGEQYTVVATWTEGGVEKTQNLVVEAGGVGASLQLPEGTVVTLSEIIPTNPMITVVPTFIASEGVVPSEDGTTATVTITDQVMASVQLDNEATRQVGWVSVQKQVEGATVGDKPFTFNYTCNDPLVEGPLTGSVTNSDGANMVRLPHEFTAGTTCVVTEDAESAMVEGYVLTVPEPWNVTVEAGKEMLKTFVNTYEPEPTPTPSDEPTPTPSDEPTTEEPTPSEEPTTPAPVPSDEPTTPETPVVTPSIPAPVDDEPDMPETGAHVGLLAVIALLLTGGGLALRKANA